ncbi:MAG: hypothetical protein J6T12_09180 [Salinivirgaceae bacterium]|nr:hypothetical protein [Salinivirgaceae bacterium]MBR5166839.1 hypothetical protein [Salinivirgaceae bacterium]
MIVRLTLLFLAVFDFVCDAYNSASAFCVKTARQLSHITAKPEVANTSTAA